MQEEWVVGIGCLLLGLLVGMVWALHKRNQAQRASHSAPLVDMPASVAQTALPVAGSRPLDEPVHESVLTSAQASNHESGLSDRAAWPQLPGLTLTRCLGQGASGMVYAAFETHPDASREAVAVKVLHHLDGADGSEGAIAWGEEARKRFLQEALVMLRLQHPSIVRWHRIEQEGSLSYAIMELLQGQALADGSGVLIHTFTPAEAVATLLQVAQALAYAHEQGVLHRDIKPENMIWDERTGQVKLADFGVVKVLDMQQTRSGMLVGTPAYMAPEQLMGMGGDGRMDVYALGVVLFQLIAGHLPFEGASLGELMRQIVQDPAPRLPNISAQLQATLDQAMAKKPPDRFASARDLALALQATPEAHGQVPMGGAHGLPSKLLPTLSSGSPSC